MGQRHPWTCRFSLTTASANTGPAGVSLKLWASVKLLLKAGSTWVEDNQFHWSGSGFFGFVWPGRAQPPSVCHPRSVSRASPCGISWAGRLSPLAWVVFSNWINKTAWRWAFIHRKPDSLFDDKIFIPYYLVVAKTTMDSTFLKRS